MNAFLSFRRRLSTIGVALLALVAICLAPSLLVTFGAIAHHYHKSKDEQFAASLRRAVAVSANVDSTIRGVEIGLRTLSHSHHLEQGDLAAFQREAQAVIGHLRIARNIWITDPGGRMLMNTVKPYGEPLPLSGNPDLIDQVVRSGTHAVSDLFEGAVARAPMVAVAVPVRDARGAIRYVLGVTILPQVLSSALLSGTGTSGWIISLHDSKRRFIARTHELERMIGRAPSADLGAAMSRAGAGTLEGLTKEGVPVIAAFTRSGYSGWSVAVGIPADHLLAQLRKSVLFVGLVAACIILAAIGSALLIAGRIRRSISALTGPAVALSRAQPVQIPRTLFMETEMMAAALREAADTLAESQFNAQHDSLTGLVNRSFLNASLPGHLDLCKRNGSTLALLYIDLDGFKLVNDLLGHLAGDEVLCVTASRLIGGVRSSDVSIRLGGDEFAVILHDTAGPGAAHIARKLIDELSQPIATRFGPAEVSASIGIALYPHDAAGADELLYEADSALYRAKRSGKRRFATAAARPSRPGGVVQTDTAACGID